MASPNRKRCPSWSHRRRVAGEFVFVLAAISIGSASSFQHAAAPPRPSLRLKAAAKSASTDFLPLEECSSPRTVLLHDWSQHVVPYQEAWDFQKAALEARAVGAAPVDRLILLQHPPTYTLGTGSTLGNVLFDPAGTDAPADVFRIERGGEVTFHGPGQIVMYPIIQLQDYRADLHWYLRALEEVVIRAIARLGVEGGREEGLTGVWVDGRKICAVGVRVRRWVTMHGLALNVDPPMGYFKHIVPCGIADKPVAALVDLVPGGCRVEDVAPALRASFEEVFGARLVEEQARLPDLMRGLEQVTAQAKAAAE